MHWTLSRAILRCSARRARRAAAAGPFVAALAAAAVLALPVVAFVAGRQLAPLVEAAATNRLLAQAFVVTVVGPALVLGLTFGALAPADRALGSQLAGAPAPALTRFVALTLAPLVVVAVPLTFPAAIGAVAASADAAAGRWVAVPLISAFIATATLGAALACAATGALRRLRLVPLLVAAAMVWIGIGLVGREPLLGFGAPLARSLAGDEQAAVGSALAALAGGVAAMVIWAVAATSGRAPRAALRQARIPLRLPRSAGRALAAAVVVRVARHRQIRKHIVIASLFALLGAAALRAVGAGELGASYVPFAAALVAAAVVPPAAVALRRDAPWLVRVCPVGVRSLARAGATAAAAAAAATIVVVVSVAAPVAVLEPAAWPLAETSAAIVIGAGIVGGCLVPWRPDRTVEQTASYVAVGAVAAVASSVLSLATTRVGAWGVPEAVFAFAAANALVAVAVAFAGVFER